MTDEIKNDAAVTAEDDTQIVVKLSKPIMRGDGKEIWEVTVNEPTSADMSKVDRTPLYLMNDVAHAKLLTRITNPQITPQMFGRMRVRDSQKLMNAVLTFLAESQGDELFAD